MSRYNVYVKFVEVNLKTGDITFELDTGKEITIDAGHLAELLINHYDD